MENFIQMIPGFLKDFNLVYVIGIISAICSALWAYKKFLYEKQIEKFKDANNNLFKTDTREVLAAIATLGVFKRDRKFKQNTIDVLLSRLYTELDYDITNAIANALVQYSNRREVKYIANELMRINRNFFFQTSPLNQRKYDLNAKLYELNQFENNQLKDGKNLLEIEKVNFKKIKQKLQLEYQSIFPKYMYELLWRKQITSDTYSRIMRKASQEINFFGKQKKVEMELYQNDFNYVQMAKITTSKCIMVRSALCDATIVDVFFSNTLLAKLIEKPFGVGAIINDVFSLNTLSWANFTNGIFSNIGLIEDCTFYGSKFYNCAFKKSKIIGSSFIGCTFKNVVFSKISFEESFFWGSSFSNCRFVNCKNTIPELFFEATFEKFDDKFESDELPCTLEYISALKNTDAYLVLSKCKDILDYRKEEMMNWLISTPMKNMTDDEIADFRSLLKTEFDEPKREINDEESEEISEDIKDS